MKAVTAMDVDQSGSSGDGQESGRGEEAVRSNRGLIDLLSSIPFSDEFLHEDRYDTHLVPMFDAYCSGMADSIPLATGDRYAELEELSFGTSFQIDSREKPYMRFRPDSTRGVRTKDGNSVLLVELLPEPGVARQGRSPYMSALPAQVPMVASRRIQGIRQNLEGFSSSAGLAVEYCPENREVIDVKILLSREAFSEALVHMGSLISEIMIWRIKSPFAHSSLFIERSALVAHALSEIERRENDFSAMRRQGLVIGGAPAFVLGILDFEIEDFFRTRWSVIVSRGQIREKSGICSIASLTHSIQVNTVTFSHDPVTGVAEARINLEDSEPFKLNPASLKAASHLYLLRYRKTVSALGAERAMRYFGLNPDA